MPRLHLRPLTGPDADVIRFPNTQAEDREAVIASLANHHAALVRAGGSYVGRHKFIEAAVAVAVRGAFDVDAEGDVRQALIDAFDHEMSLLFPATA